MPRSLTVIYDTHGPDAHEWGSLDDAIKRIVGVPSEGQGTAVESGERDIGFYDMSADAVAAAVARLEVELPSVRVAT